MTTLERRLLKLIVLDWNRKAWQEEQLVLDAEGNPAIQAVHRAQAFQYYAAANEITRFIKDTMPKEKP